METRVTLTPYASNAVALQDDQATSPWQQSLNGVWKFYWTEVLDQSPANLQHYSVADWPEIQVPGNRQMQGFGYPKFRNIQHPFPADPPHMPKNDSPVGCYRRPFQVPQNCSNESGMAVVLLKLLRTVKPGLKLICTMGVFKSSLAAILCPRITATIAARQ